MQDLSGYKPEEPKELTNDAFSYKGPVNVLFARIEESEQESEYYGTPAGSNVFSVCLEVPEDAEENAKRRVYKKWQLDSAVIDKKEKTPVHKLADWLYGAGLTFKDLDGLKKVAEQLVSKPFEANIWIIKMKGGDMVQMSAMKSPGTYGKEVGGQKVAF